MEIIEDSERGLTADERRSTQLKQKGNRTGQRKTGTCSLFAFFNRRSSAVHILGWPDEQGIEQEENEATENKPPIVSVISVCSCSKSSV
jgi:hypothetical protein